MKSTKKLAIKGQGLKFKELLDIDVVGIERPRDELLALRSRLAKEANKRMTQLENSKSEISGEPFTYGAYEHYAVKYLRGAKQKRFGRIKSASDKNIVHEINVLQKFLKAPSSKVSAMKKFEASSQEAFKQLGFERTKSKAFYSFISSGAWQEMRQSLPSGEVMKFMASQAHNADDYKKMMQLLDEYMSSERETSVEDFKSYVKQRWNQ